MKNTPFAIVVLLAILSSCARDGNDEQVYTLANYDESLDIMQNMDCLFRNAETVLGDGTALVKIIGTQKGNVSGKEFSLNWYCVFINDSNRLDIDVSNKEMTVVEMKEQIIGYEYLFRDDVNLGIPINQLWDKCILDNRCDLYSCELYRSLTWPKLDHLIFNAWKEKSSTSIPGIDYYSYNAKTGERIYY